MRTDRRLAGRYVLEREIASGGMATVWRARDDVLSRDVAVKILHDHLAQEPGFLDRFRQEAITAARLSHPAVVRIFDTGIDDGACFIVMELMEGTSLAALIGRALGPAEATRIARGMLDGLAHAHDRGVIHRDVKPGNVLIDPSGQAKVTDFGIAKAAFGRGDVTTTGRLLGTARYLAPEQVAESSVDHRTDLYAAGIVLYEMLTGRPPFKGDTELSTATTRLTQDPTPPRSIRPGIPRALETVVMRALARDPDRRFQSAAEMADALDRATGDVRPSAPPPRAPATDEPKESFFRAWMLVPLVLIAVTAAAIGAGVLLGGLELGGPLGVRPKKDQPPAAASSLNIADAEDHDPEGDDTEHPELVDAAIDGDTASVWHTEGYDTEDLGGLKSGVGIVFDLSRSSQITGLRLRTEAEDETSVSGWRFELKGSQDGTAFSDPLQSADGQTEFTATPTTEVRLNPVSYRYVLVWVTGLAQADDGKYRGSIAEAEIFGE